MQCISSWIGFYMKFDKFCSRCLIRLNLAYVVQTGIISPSKLRMKLLGARKKDGSNSNSSRTSPSRLEDPEFVNSLLSSNIDNLDDEGWLLQFIY
jgi:hypothetical protein